MKYTKAQKEAALSTVGAGVPYRKVAEEQGINPGTLYDWLRLSRKKTRDLPLLLVQTVPNGWALEKLNTPESLKAAILAAQSRGEEVKLVKEVPFEVSISWKED